MTKEEIPELTNTHPQVPDGGYGWMILTSAFFVMFMIDGLFGSFGLLLPALMEELDSSPSLTSLAGSLIVGSLLFSALVACPLIEKFGCRVVAVVGSLIASLGLILSSFAESIWIFLATYGLITGNGIGLVYLPTIIMVNKYFDKRRGIATSIMFCGSGFGVMVISPTTNRLLNIYGWRGTIIILAGLCLQLCVVCALFKNPCDPCKNSKILQAYSAAQECTISTEVEITVNGKMDGNTHGIMSYDKTSHHCRKTRSNSLNPTLLPKVIMDSFKSNDDRRSTSSLPHSMLKSCGDDTLYSQCNSSQNAYHVTNSNKSIFSQKDILYSGSTKRISQCDHVASNNSIAMFVNGRQYSQVSIDDSNTSTGSEHESSCNHALLTNIAFWLVCIGAVLIQMSQFIPTLFLGDIGKGIGLSSSQVSLIYSIFGVTNTIGRLIPGFIIDNSKVTATGLCTSGMIGCAICCFLFPLCSNFPTVMAYGIAYGFFIAFFCPLQPIMVLDNVGIDNLTKGLSILTAMKAPAAIAGPPIAGLLYEKTQNYDATILFTGGLCVATAIIYIILPIYNCFKSEGDSKATKNAPN